VILDVTFVIGNESSFTSSGEGLSPWIKKPHLIAIGTIEKSELFDRFRVIAEKEVQRRRYYKLQESEIGRLARQPWYRL
jgi:hypothetical protein